MALPTSTQYEDGLVQAVHSGAPLAVSPLILLLLLLLFSLSHPEPVGQKQKKIDAEKG